MGAATLTADPAAASPLGTATVGAEWVVEAHGCDPARLRDLTALQGLFSRMVDELDLHPVQEPLWHVFPGAGGITGLCLLAESHLACHTFPEHGSICLNLFCCKPRVPWDFQEGLRKWVGADSVEVRRLERRYVTPGTASGGDL